uniref:DNA2/NAM7 helicase helicase domain-containing protein n=1 Tax=Panagrolaimus sp. ES5 TaxID=591445 RepID=A0AC34GXD3_9BILA
MSFRPPRGNRRGGGNDRGRGRGDRGRGGSSRGRGRSHNEEVAKYGISYQKIQELCDKMDKDRILSGSAELLAAVLRDAKPFYNRLEDLWPEITKQLNFLRVIVATASNNQADVLTLTHDFLAQVLSSKFIEKAIDENIYPMTYNQSLQTAQHAEFSHNMVKLLLLGFQIRPTLMDPHLPRVETVINRLKAVKNVYFLEEELVKDVEKLEVALKARQEAKLRQHEAKPVRQPRERPEFLGSAGAPPSNFRHLSIVPTAEDISTNYEPYLRPAKVRGQYDDDEHYLDVMFRLLREDLHRPLREGIAAYKNKDGKKADIFVYKNVYLDEPVQHKKTGELVSYAHITTMPFGQPIPFSNYLVRVQTNTAIPGYLNGNHLDFNTLFKHYRGETEYTARGIQNDLDINDFNMDQSQFEALKYALTSSLAIIQGPPGTGKTYIGLQIAKLLLNNRTVWNPHYGRLVLAHLRRRIYDSDGEEHYLTDEEEVYHEDCAPMLVICYTNHALDQFLEGISDFCTDIIRVGGRSKNEAMEEYNLCSKRYSHKSDLQQRYYEMRDWVRSTQKDLTEKSDEMKKLRTRLVDPSILSSFVSSSEKPYFNSTKTFTEYDKTSCSTTLYKWLTQTTLNAPVDTFCLDVIYQLTDWGVPEIKAKNAVAFACQNEEDFDANYLYRQLWTPKYKKLPNNYLLPYTPNLPRIADVKNVMALGYSFLATAEMLINADVNSIREEHQRSRRLEIPQHRLRPIDEEEEQNVVAEDLEDLVLNDENEDDKMIVDNSLFHDINDKQEKNSEQNKKQNFIWFDYSTINNFANAITTSTPMTEEEANNIKDVWKLSLQKQLEERLLNRMKQLSELRSVADIQILKRAKVVGMTTTGAAKHQSTLRALRPRIVIVEEAAEVLEAHLLASLTHACQHLILIGDHKQLRPNPAVYDLAVKYNLEISLFERLINNGYPYRMLENQHRMCP